VCRIILIAFFWMLNSLYAYGASGENVADLLNKMDNNTSITEISIHDLWNMAHKNGNLEKINSEIDKKINVYLKNFQSSVGADYAADSAREICIDAAPFRILKSRLELAKDMDTPESAAKVEEIILRGLKAAAIEIRREARSKWDESLTGTDDWTDMVKAELAYRAALDQGWRNIDLSTLLTEAGLEAKRPNIRFADTLMTYRYSCYVDMENTLWLKKQLQFSDWFRISVYGEEADLSGWLIVQHSIQDPEFQRDVLERLEGLAREGETNPKYYALLWDRVAIFSGEKQKFGTQFTCGDEGVLEPSPLLDPDHVDRFRSDVGLDPLSENSLLGQPC